MFAGGFNQKTIKVDLYVRINYAYPQRKNTRRLSTKDRAETLTWGVGRPTCRSASLWDPRVSLPFECRFSTAPRLHLRRLFKSVWSEGPELMLPPIYVALYPLPAVISETLIHISDSDQDTLGGLGLELSNVVD